MSIISSLPAWGQWILTTVLGFVAASLLGTLAGFAAFIPTSFIVSFLRIPGAQGQGAIGYMLIGSAIAGGAVGGAVVAWLQWFVLRRWIDSSVIASWWWILASAVGWIGILYAITMLAYTHVAGPVGQPDGSFVETTIWDNAPQIAKVALQLIVAAIFLGAFQALALKLKLSLAIWWIMTNIFIFLIAATIMVLWVRGAGGMFGIPVFLVGFSPIYAAISGKVLLWLLAPTRV